jgi:uncharacterized protein (TIGR03435 family)
MFPRIALCFIPVAALSQQLSFDAASVKPSPRQIPDVLVPTSPGGPGTSDPGRIHYTWMPLKRLITTAYNVKDFQISGPDWLGSARFEVEATMPPSTTMEQFRSMLQALLADRFKLKLHPETKELPIYSLGLSKAGIKMKPGIDAGEPRRIQQFTSNNRVRLQGYRQTIDDLANRLSPLVSRPVFDTTRLEARYDFVLTFSLDGSATSDPEAPPDIFAALPAQLGLQLESKKGPVELLVIDHVERIPTGN